MISRGFPKRLIDYKLQGLNLKWLSEVDANILETYNDKIEEILLSYFESKKITNIDQNDLLVITDFTGPDHLPIRYMFYKEQNIAKVSMIKYNTPDKPFHIFSVIYFMNEYFRKGLYE